MCTESQQPTQDLVQDCKSPVIWKKAAEGDDSVYPEENCEKAVNAVLKGTHTFTRLNLKGTQ